MADFTLIVDFLAAVPVSHRVRIDYYQRDFGILKPDFKLDQDHPVITDLDTGIHYAEASHFKQWRQFVDYLPQERPLANTYFGVVRSCYVASSGGDHSYTYTRLVVSPSEPPAGP